MKTISFNVPCCDNCYNGYFDETSCFIGHACPSESIAGHGVFCEHYEGDVSFKHAREYLMKDVIKELERRMETLHKKSYLERIEEYKKAITLIRGDMK